MFNFTIMAVIIRGANKMEFLQILNTSKPHPGHKQMILSFEQIRIQIVASLHTLNLPLSASLFVYSEVLSDSHVRLNKSRLHYLCFQKVTVHAFWKNRL